MIRPMDKMVDSTEVEMIDLTKDYDIEPRQHLAIKDEEEITPLIYDLADNDDDEDDGDEYIRELTPDEFLKAELERLTISEPASYRKGTKTEAALTASGFFVQADTDAELYHQGRQEYFRVKELFSDGNGGLQMRGILLVRTRLVSNMLPKKYNELCAIIKARADKNKIPEVDDYLVTRPLSSVICTRKIIFTNQSFPTHSFREQGIRYDTWDDVEDKAELVCRYKHVEFCDTVNWNVPSEALVRLRRHECDLGVPDSQLMQAWCSVKKQKKRPSTQRFIDMTQDEDEDEVQEVRSKLQKTFKRYNRRGVYERRTNSVVTEKFTPHRHPLKHKQTQKTKETSVVKAYLYGDVCAGAGGATTAAKKAGFHVKFALDHAEDPCATLRENFPDAEIFEMDIFDFCNGEDREDMRVDVLHISFPCQTYSIAHTHAGKNDERNEAAGYSVIPLLKKCRPRIVTFEQSPNITKEKHRPSFEALIHQITEMGFSVRWKVVSFADTGNAQSRNRLFIIASCPGMPLPAFATATHGVGCGLHPPTTINDILKQVPREIEPHMAVTVNWKNKRDSMPYNGDCQLRGCITTSGGETNLHPNGKRSFNNQELAQLQGFPSNHKFVGNKSSITRQIGNAVPAKAATPYFKEILKSLKKFDDEVAAQKDEIIELD